MTLEALDSLSNQKHIEDLAVTVYLVDDGSHDGTIWRSLSIFIRSVSYRVTALCFWNGVCAKLSPVRWRMVDGYL